MPKGAVDSMRAQREAQHAEAERRAKAEVAPVAKPKGKLTQRERDTLKGCELAIERGLKTFVEVGQALGVIRESELYRETHKTWESYCRERWKMSGGHAQRIATGAEIAGQVPPIGRVPKSESQIRPLAKLPAEKRAEAWKKATEDAGGEPTAKQVEAAVQLVLGTDAVKPEADIQLATAPAEIPHPVTQEPAPPPKSNPQLRIAEEAPAELRKLRAMLATFRTALKVETDAEILPAILKLKHAA